VVSTAELKDDIVSSSGSNLSGVEVKPAITDEDKVISSRNEASSGGDESESLGELHFG
jgi:hypothetical protein